MSRRRHRPQDNDPSRRDFLWKGACAALTAAGITGTISDLRLINAAAGQTVPTDYKALVCIFLFGGNDGNNLLLQTDSATYSNYTTTRGAIALPLPGTTGGPLALNPLSNDGHTYGLHPSCVELTNLFNSGQVAILANVGTLLAPITLAQYKAHSVALPPQLFSHNDQQVEWQTSIEDQPAKTGWGGRSADLLYSLNGNNQVSMNISLAGANTFETGNTINQYNVSTSGAIALNVSPASQLQALKDLVNLNHTNLYESAFASEMNTAITDASLLNNAITATSSSTYWTTPFPTSSLGKQLKMIARLIQAAPTLGHNRQIFFASIGGFDLHGTEGAQTGAHANLLADLSASMNALYKATLQLGVSPSVTTFTASDFSRTYPVNPTAGTDHAWGNHHIIMGGSVIGQRLYGTYPTLTVNGPDDTGTGRWIPTTSVDQYSATLAKWFGVSSSNMSSVFPYLGRFATPDLGFMNNATGASTPAIVTSGTRTRPKPRTAAIRK
ncbi:MAG TPA: DUF1501 domain-containing protein [Humisphaera sp.]|jgi:uncharacterized protein (DUF1501 family)|nr:DUF1501 domain-containing protein [Humisphaera sp.]